MSFVVEQKIRNGIYKGQDISKREYVLPEYFTQEDNKVFHKVKIYLYKTLLNFAFCFDLPFLKNEI